jgi:hypothetical protein
MMVIATGFINFAPAAALWLIFSLAGIAALATLRGAAARATPWWLVAVRLAAVSGAALVLASPGAWSPSNQPATRPIDIVIDGSSSMSLCDNSAAPGITRLERVSDTWLAPIASPDLAEREAPPTYWRLDEQLSRLTREQAATLVPDGAATHLWKGMLEIAAATSTAPPTPRDVVLLTDGRDTTGAPPAGLAESLRARGVRLFAVPLGHASDTPSIRIVADPPPGLAHAGQPVPIRIGLRSNALAGLAADIIITDTSSGAEAARCRITLADAWQGDVAITPSLTPAERGGVAARLYSVRIEIPGRASAPIELPTADAALQVTDRLIRVLMLEGSPSWQTRFMARAFASDPRFALTTVTAIAMPEQQNARAPLRITQGEPTPDGQRITVSDSFEFTPGAFDAFDVVLVGSNISAVLDPAGQSLLSGRAAAGGALLLLQNANLTGPRVRQLAEHTVWPGRLLGADESRAWSAAACAEVYEHALGEHLPTLADAILFADRGVARAGEPIELTARLTVAADADLSGWSITVAGATPSARLPLREAPQTSTRSRRLKSTYSPKSNGSVCFELRDESGVVRSSCIVIIRTPDPERDDTMPDHATLAELARATGGSVLGPADHDVLRSRLSAERATAVTPPIFRPLLLSPWMLGGIGALFVLEWTARRKRGLP